MYVHEHNERYKKSLIKLAHTLKSGYEPFLNDDIRRDWLEANFGKRSFKDLTIPELEKVVEFLRYRTNMPDKITYKQLRMMKTLWMRYSRQKTATSLKRWIGRRFGFYPLRLKDISKRDAQKILAAMQNMFDCKI